MRLPMHERPSFFRTLLSTPFGGAIIMLATLFVSSSALALESSWIPSLDALNVFAKTSQHIVVVDKERQHLLILDKKKPESFTTPYACTTGQKVGDKQYEGDLRTPEGIYFIRHKRTHGLDYEKYGGIAYTLNYPNPVDVLRKKTGHGIWIHSKGREIIPLETQGCVALNLHDIDALAENFASGTPVVLTHSITTEKNTTEAELQHTADTLRTRVKEWSRAWSTRSNTFFSLYDATAYSIAQRESFHSFKANKERLFHKLPWISSTVENIRVLQGPGYWVTWFDQYYRAPNLSKEGIRRLYWQSDAEGTFRIVGMEWIPENRGMEQRYLKLLYGNVVSSIQAWQKAWEEGNLAEYGKYYTAQARQATRVGKDAIVEHKRQLWKQQRPARVVLENIRITTHPKGVKATMRQHYQDAGGYSDSGTKVLYLQPVKDSWNIVREDWRPGY